VHFFGTYEEMDVLFCKSIFQSCYKAFSVEVLYREFATTISVTGRLPKSFEIVQKLSLLFSAVVLTCKENLCGIFPRALVMFGA